MDEKKTYQWLVQKGRIEISEQFPNVYIELDYESNDFCELTKQDVLDIRNILFHLSSSIWSSTKDKPTHPTAVFQPISSDSFRWDFDGSAFLVICDFPNLTLQLKYENSSKFVFSVNSVVELIQIFDHYLDNLESKES